MARANAWALLGLGPAIVLLLGGFLALHGWRPLYAATDAFFNAPLVPLLVFVAGVVAHEALHALAWKAASGLPWREIRLGFQWKTLTPYAHARAPMTARAYRVGAATPGVVLGLVPAAVGLATGGGGWMLFGLLFTLAAGGDALILWLLRGVAPGRLVEDHPARAGCYVWEEER
jgi:hypothetical protein